MHFFLEHEGQDYKLELQFGDILESGGCFLGDAGDEGDRKVDAILLKVWFCCCILSGFGFLFLRVCDFCSALFFHSISELILC